MPVFEGVDSDGPSSSGREKRDDSLAILRKNEADVDDGANDHEKNRAKKGGFDNPVFDSSGVDGCG